MKVKEFKKMIENLPDDTEIEIFHREYNGCTDDESLEPARFLYAQSVYRDYSGNDCSNDALIVYYADWERPLIGCLIDSKDLISLENI